VPKCFLSIVTSCNYNRIFYNLWFIQFIAARDILSSHYFTGIVTAGSY